MGQLTLPQYVIEKRPGCFYFRRFVRQQGRRVARYVRLPHPLDPRFADAYARALDNVEPGPRPGSVNAVIAAFLDSPRFSKIGSSAAGKYRESFRRLSATFGDDHIDDVAGRHIIAFIETMAATPAMANRVLSNCGVLWKWAVPRGLARVNPCEGVERFEEQGRGAPWALEDVVRAVTEMQPQVANVVALAFYTGQRKGDLLRLAPEHIKGDAARFKTQKSRFAVEVTVTLNEHAQEILQSLWPADGGPFLRGKRGQPWGRGFDTEFAKERKRLGLSGRFHDIRHTAATIAEEALPGVADALLGHADPRTTARYTRTARQRRDAARAADVIPILRPR